MIIGILGGGQLGRMLALAGYPLGLHFRFLEPAPDAPVEMLAELRPFAFDDLHALDDFLADLDRVTYEFESVPVATARHLAQHVPVYPPPHALETAQDRLLEKTLFQKLGIPTPAFANITCREDLVRALPSIGLPAVLKTRRLGYDGKGQLLLRAENDTEQAWQELGSVPLILEEFVRFDREVSLLAVRSVAGQTAFYPLVENHHREGILRRSLAPARQLTSGLQTLAERHVLRLLDSLNYVGVLAVEFFQCGERLLANEMAPRVHNSGHWTIEGAETSQFENHLRAILGLPLGSTRAIGCSAMLNLIGAIPEAKAVFSVPGTHLHLYGKQPRPGRKLGHITICAQEEAAIDDSLARLLPIVDG